jgi:acetyl esterase/lipase
MKFTKSNSVKEIIRYPFVMEYLPIFFPIMFLNLIPKDMEDYSLSEIEQKVVMPWGSPFLSDMLVEAANMIVDIIENKSYSFIPLWEETQNDDYKPKLNKISDKDSVFIIKSTKKHEGKRPAVIICPGGGYNVVSISIEGIPIAKKMEDHGYCAFVLNYRVNPNFYPEPQKDLILAIQHVRANAEKYGIDPDDIMIMGSSAGGHLCASSVVLCDEISEKVIEDLETNQRNLADKYKSISAKPNKVCLNYPVISFLKEAHEDSFQALTGGSEQLRKKLSVENFIDYKYPKTFVWACEDDELVPVSNAKRMGEALETNHVENKVCIYPTGGHGCGLAVGTSAEGWIEELINFMKD